MNTLNIETKVDGTSTLSADEFNRLVTKTNDIIEAVNTLEQNQSSGGGSTPSGGGSSNNIISIVDKSTSAEDKKVALKASSGVSEIGNPEIIELTKKKKGINTTILSGNNINLEPRETVDNNKGGNISLKPGDDIELCSHHRGVDKNTEVAVKVVDGESHPVKLLLFTGEITLSTKGKDLTKTKDDEGHDTSTPLYNEGKGVLNINVTDGDNKAYLKLRARAIDLRCLEHGGIALQPKGCDSDGHMNKIKFEHGGGDGLEFGTFNTEHTSIFTDDYRFNKAGVWKMTTRQTVVSDKADESDNTTAYKYVKQEDDLYDIIDEENDPTTTTEAIIKSANALNNEFIETSLSSKKDLKISAISNYKIIAYDGVETPTVTFTGTEDIPLVLDAIYTKDQLKTIVSGNNKLSNFIDTKLPFSVTGDNGIYRLSGNITPKIALEAEEEVDLDAKYGDVVVTSGDTIKMEAPEIRLNAIKKNKTGGMVNFGATQDVVFLTNKLTSGLQIEAPATPTKIKQLIQNNSSDTVYWDSTNNVFRIPLNKIYIDANHDTLLRADNYSEGMTLYFADGSVVPADYTCYVGYTKALDGNYITEVYVVGTKGREPVAKKKLFQKKVATYTSDDSEVIGSSRIVFETAEDQSYEQIKGINFIEFEFDNFNTTGLTAVAPEEFVTVSECELNDIIELVNYFKTGAGQANGPWASQL